MTEATPDTLSPDERQPLVRRATYAAVAVAGTLVAAKLAAYLLTGSVSLLSTLVDSMLDVCASGINLFAVRHAMQPADREHRFGHGKAEPLAGLGQAAFIAGSAVFLVIEAVSRLFDPAPVKRGEVGIGVMVFAIVLTLALVAYQRYAARRTGSVAIKADSVHYQVDVLVNLAVIVSLIIISGLGWQWVDPVFAVGIAVYIMHGAWDVARRSLNLLMDKEFPDADRERIKQLAQDHPETHSVHDLRTRSSGPQSFIQLHLELDPALSLTRAHDIADEVEGRIRAAFPDAEVIIHQDPAGLYEGHGPVAREEA